MTGDGRRGFAHRLAAVGRDVAGAYGRHTLGQHAAAISYRVLFSLVPFMALVVAILDFALPDDTRREIVDWVLDQIPGTSDLESTVDEAITAAGTATGTAGLIGLVLLLWSATGMMSSLRMAFASVWGYQRPRFVRGKLIDGLLVLGGGLAIVVAFGTTVLVQTVQAIGDEIATAIGLPTQGRLAGTVAGAVATLAVVFVTLAALYRALSPRTLRWRDLLLGAALAALGLQALTIGYAFYLAHFSSLSAVYGSLGAVLGFLVLVYLGALVVLVGGEIAAAWPRSADAEAPA
jgi:membrane protein